MNRNAKEIEILKAAARCVGKFGAENTNAQKVSEELGIAQSGIFYYFPKQTQLFDSLLSYIASVNHELVSGLQKKRKHQSHYEQLMTHIEGNFLWAKRHPDHVAVLLHSVARTGQSKGMKKLVNQIFQTGEDRIYGYLAGAVAEKEIDIQNDLRNMAAFLHKSLIGAIVSFYYSRGPNRTVKECLSELQRAVGSIVVRH